MRLALVIILLWWRGSNLLFHSEHSEESPSDGRVLWIYHQTIIGGLILGSDNLLQILRCSQNDSKWSEAEKSLKSGLKISPPRLKWWRRNKDFVSPYRHCEVWSNLTTTARVASCLAMTTVYIKRLKIFDKPKWKYNDEKVFKATSVTDFAANHSECL